MTDISGRGLRLRRRGGLPLWCRLVGLACVPLLLAAALASVLVNDRVRAAARARSIAGRAEAIARLVGLQKALVDEGVTAFVNDATTATLHLPQAPRDATNVAATDAAMRAVPAAMRATGQFVALDSALRRARTFPVRSQADLVADYQSQVDPIEAVARVVDAQLTLIERDAGSLAGNQALLAQSNALSLADAIVLLSIEGSGDELRFAVAPPVAQAQLRTTNLAGYDRAVELSAQMSAAAPPALRGSWQQLRSDPAYEHWIDNAGRIGGGLPGPATFTTADLAATLGQAPALAEKLSRLQRDATDNLLAEAQRERGEALRSAWIAGAVTIALEALSLLACVLIGRSIRRPLAALTQRAQLLSQGTLVLGDERGVAEVAVVANALNEAVDTLTRTAEQADALGRGELDHSSLARPIPGRLGLALASSVRRLAHLQSRLHDQATYDVLTGLLNRRAGMELLDGLLADSAPDGVSVVVVDLDGFKLVNDIHGHAVGDELLAGVAALIAAETGAGDQLCRLGGDEFVVISAPARSVTDMVRMAAALQQSLARDLLVAGHTFAVSASVGIDRSGPGDSTTSLLARADAAVLAGKRSGRGRVTVFDEAMRVKLEVDTAMDLALRVALRPSEFPEERGDQFRLHYQPVVDTVTGIMTGAEALLRWDMPGVGPVRPDVFIAVAEQSELILDVDCWVLDAAARQLAAWRDHSVLGRTELSVNISARHLGRGSLVSDVRRALAAHGVPPERLVVEITETALSEDHGAVMAELRELRAGGVRVALDDFGTGYTSLRHLASLPVDVIKIDRSFVIDPAELTGDSGIVAMVTSIAHRRGLTVVAEGVEEEEQRLLVQRLGCEKIQGYYFSRPLTPEQIETWSLASVSPPARVG